VAKQPAKQCVWSPRGDHIACTTPRDVAAIGAQMGNTGPSLITVTSANGGAPIAISDSASLNTSPTWSPDGRRLYFVSNRDAQRDIYYVRIGGDGRAVGEMRRLTTALNAVTLSLSRDGRRLAYSVYTPQANIWSLPVLPAGTATFAMATQVTFGHQLVESMEVTRDGKTLIYDADRNGNSDIWRLNLGGGDREPEAMTSDVVDEFGGSLSPDGRRLVFYGYGEGSSRGIVWVKPMDGGPLQRVNTPTTYGIWPEWAPDGRTLTWPCGGRQRCVATPDSAGRWSVETKDGVRSNWSPDGQWSTNARRSGFGGGMVHDSVWILRRGDSTERLLYAQRSTTDPRVVQLQWSADSRSLFFRHNASDGVSTFWSLSIDGGPPRPVARLDDPKHPSYRGDFSTDGRRIYFAVNDRQSDIAVVELIER
jgi:Tol biopolymer transport system component